MTSGCGRPARRGQQSVARPQCAGDSNVTRANVRSTAGVAVDTLAIMSSGRVDVIGACVRRQSAADPAAHQQVTPHAVASAKLAKLQAVLREAIRRGIEDPAFRAVFDDDAAIRTRWPVLYNGAAL
jgi:hypothetical protein